MFKKSLSIIAISGVLVCLLVSSVSGQTVTKIKGVLFSDYAYQLQHHDEDVEGLNEFTFRRVYFTFENNLSKNIKTRVRFEAASNKFGSSGKIYPFVKHVYLEWKNLIPNHKLYLGIGETNAFKNAENLWGYRSIEKTVMDLNKISSSADLGVALKGDLTENVHHWLTIMNGTGYGSPEVDKYKKIGYAFWVNPIDQLTLEAYADYEKQDPDNPAFKYGKDYLGSSGYYTLKGMIGYSALNYTIAAEVFQRTNKESGIENVTVANDEVAGFDKADVVRSGFSVFGSLITPIPKLKVFARYDSYDPNTGDGVATKFSDGTLTTGLDDDHSLIIAGLDYIPSGNVHFMPNVMIKSYSKEGKDADITGRVTMYIKFDSGKIITD